MNDDDRPTLGEESDPIISDEAALDAIQLLLDGTEWEAETFELVASLVIQSGRQVRDPDEMPVEPQPRMLCRRQDCDEEIVKVAPRPDRDFDYVCEAGHVSVEPF